MSCPYCDADPCQDPMHELPDELFQEVVARLPPDPTISRVARRWEAAVRATSLIRARFVTHPAPLLQARWNPDTRALCVSFSVQAHFQLAPGAPPGTLLRIGQYRQLVRGAFYINGVPVAHSLPFGANLSPTTFQLDGPGGGRHYYGERREGLGRANLYGSDLSTISHRGSFDENGAYFQASDMPLVRGTAGQTVEIDLEFQGLLVDTSLRRVLVSVTWRVQGRAVVPQPTASSAASAAGSH